jgi:N-acetylglutamate synthase-like GNAT family acetyltransferase
MLLLLREARPDELPSLSDLCLRSKAVWGYDEAFLEACRRELTLQADELDTTKVVVGEDSNGVAGMVQIKVVGTQADLLKLFVEPTMLRKGIGCQLFDWAVAEARRRGARQLMVESDPEAAPFYRRMGARDVGVVASGSIPGRLLPRLACELSRFTTRPRS